LAGRLTGDALGQAHLYGGPVMRAADASSSRRQAGWASRAKGSTSALNWRRDIALPLIVLVAQVAGEAAAGGHLDHRFHVGGPGALGWAAVVTGPLALVGRRRHPVAVLWVTFALTLVGPSHFAYLSLIVAFFVAATTGHRRPAWLAIVLGFASSVWLVPLANSDPSTPLNNALLLGAWLAVLVVFAEAWRMRTERVAEAREAHRLDQKRRASEERLQMARDLHDVIGHTISLINVQAGVGLDLMGSQPEQARTALSAIKTASKEALDELRTMLVALRDVGEQAPRSPTPGLDRLPELVQLTSAAGFSVTTEVVGKQRPLPAAADVAAFRIVQESLTNVARHAGRANALVRLTYGPGQLRIEVIDDGRGAAPTGAGEAGTGAGEAGSGTGIAGMYERASALGGHLEAAPRPEGGFVVTADLPFGAPQ
jgi:signal transduction histidine kinase